MQPWQLELDWKQPAQEGRAGQRGSVERWTNAHTLWKDSLWGPWVAYVPFLPPSSLICSICPTVWIIFNKCVHTPVATPGATHLAELLELRLSASIGIPPIPSLLLCRFTNVMLPKTQWFKTFHQVCFYPCHSCAKECHSLLMLWEIVP